MGEAQTRIFLCVSVFCTCFNKKKSDREVGVWCLANPIFPRIFIFFNLTTVQELNNQHFLIDAF